MSLYVYVCTNSFLSRVFKFIWIHCGVCLFVCFSLIEHDFGALLCNWLVSTFAKEIWKIHGPCSIAGIEFISFFPEDTFLDAENKIFRIGELTRLPPLPHVETLRCGFMLWESRERVIEGPRLQGQVESFLSVWNLCHHKMQKWPQEQDPHP